VSLQDEFFTQSLNGLYALHLIQTEFGGGYRFAFQNGQRSFAGLNVTIQPDTVTSIA
jgi:hypothetical protein